MADDRQGRDKQADDAERRERERAVEEALTRADEVEPSRDDPGEQLGALDEALETHEYPTTTEELVEAYGDYEVETQRGSASLGDVLAPTDDQTFASADEVRSQVLQLVSRR